MDISTSYDSYISPIQNIDKEKIKNLDKKKLKEASQGLEAEFLKVFLKQSKKLMFDNQNKENKAPGKDIVTDFMFERLAEHMAMSSPIEGLEVGIFITRDKECGMAKESSFDIVSNVDVQEVSNAHQQAVRELTQRYDLKQTGATIEFSKNSVDRKSVV